ncbi:Cof-type HAD-IIB family hydrolase [Luteolibacter flavescens]|uniref:Cof-type HAD-IIB family hydrolase n=1 Tax=Luteolibacter flavescens TaxID=1859460 RepID=A0ABT3FW93_9BACT|nr:HAD family hydrolase [Luteolibacter flavescens]MCW1887863.1 Cof-type HAD-IIB family hydrolase [Luteolibacter flavescens]
MTATHDTDTPIRLAAIDLDGTLLGPDHTISPENHAAIQRLADAGVEIVLASGRHYRSMAPFALQLPTVRWIVSSQGAEVASADRSHIVAQQFLREDDVRTLIHAADTSRRPDGAPAYTTVYYTADEVFTDLPEPDDLIRRYTSLAGRVPLPIPAADLPGMQVQKVIWMSDDQSILDLRAADRHLAWGLQGLQTMDYMYEFMPLDTSKAWGLQILADSLGISPRQAVTFGDGENDIPMFQWSGHSYAMPHGWENAKRSARHTAPEGPPETAFARAVHHLLG